jgi:hypothetical protein
VRKVSRVGERPADLIGDLVRARNLSAGQRLLDRTLHVGYLGAAVRPHEDDVGGSGLLRELL